MSDNDRYGELFDYLRGEGYTDDQIKQIIAQVQEYEQEIQVDSVMDSIDLGMLDIEAIIAEALKDRAE